MEGFHVWSVMSSTVVETEACREANASGCGVLGVMLYQGTIGVFDEVCDVCHFHSGLNVGFGISSDLLVDLCRTANVVIVVAALGVRLCRIPFFGPEFFRSGSMRVEILRVGFGMAWWESVGFEEVSEADCRGIRLLRLGWLFLLLFIF